MAVVTLTSCLVTFFDHPFLELSNFPPYFTLQRPVRRLFYCLFTWFVQLKSSIGGHSSGHSSGQWIANYSSDPWNIQWTQWTAKNSTIVPTCNLHVSWWFCRYSGVLRLAYKFEVSVEMMVVNKRLWLQYVAMVTDSKVSYNRLFLFTRDRWKSAWNYELSWNVVSRVC